MIVAGTGHRPNKLGGYAQDVHPMLTRIAQKWLLDAKGIEKVISGMALGWDQALCEAALNLSIPVIAAVPFRGQENRWSYLSRHKYGQLLNRCFKIEIISPGGYSAEKMQVRNEWMVDRTDLILAMFDGSSGGTKNCIDYARKTNKHVFNLYEKFSKFKSHL